MEELIGRKVRGFRFETTAERPGYSKDMDKYIGMLGEIITQGVSVTKTPYVEVKFPDGKTWNYKLDQIEKHLVDYLPNIPVISDSVNIEVSDDNETWYKAEVLIQLSDGDYVTTDLIRWKLGREIQEDEKKTV
jgi:hypothetical protein